MTESYDPDTEKYHVRYIGYGFETYEVDLSQLKCVWCCSCDDVVLTWLF